MGRAIPAGNFELQGGMLDIKFVVQHSGKGETQGFSLAQGLFV